EVLDRTRPGHELDVAQPGRRRVFGDEQIEDRPAARFGDGREQHDALEVRTAEIEKRAQARPRKAAHGVRDQSAFEIKRKNARPWPVFVARGHSWSASIKSAVEAGCPRNSTSQPTASPQMELRSQIGT